MKKTKQIKVDLVGSHKVKTKRTKRFEEKREREVDLVGFQQQFDLLLPHLVPLWPK